jgi:hypothetical protein
VKKAVSSGVTVVAAAGNESGDTAFVSPANVFEAIVVSAIDSKDAIAYFSNFGESVDFAAPGVDIISTVPGGGKASLSGTSMASPHVAAAAALVVAEDPSRTPAQVDARLQQMVDDKGNAGWDSKYGHGVINMSKDAPAKPPVTTTPTPTPSSAPNPNKKLVGYKWSVDEVNLKLNVNGTFALLAYYDDGSTVDATQTSTVKVANESVARLAANGVLEPVSVGETYVWVEFPTVNDVIKVPGPLKVAVTGNIGRIVELRFEKSSFEVSAGSSEKLVVIGIFEDGSSGDVTSQVNVGSTDTSICEVKDGVLYGNKAGKASIYISGIPIDEILLPKPVEVTVK